MSRRSEDRLAARATNLARIAAAEERDAASRTKTVTARYLAVGGAHVTVERDANNWHRAICEACGPLNFPSQPGPEAPNEHAQEHAETCRRIPERLWPENAGGAK